MDHLWGIDLGGTKIEGVVIDAHNYNRVLFRSRIQTQADRGYNHILERIKTLIDSITSGTGLKPEEIGIGIPGTLDSETNFVKNSNTVFLNGKPLKEDIEKKLGIPVSIANDANCFALAESRIGIIPDKLPEAEIIFGVIMGTGVGGGLIIGNKIWNGLQGIAGEWGHSFLDTSGGDCYCGNNGCVEKILSGPALEKFYYDNSGNKKNLMEIYKLHKASKNEFATQTISRLLHFFGKGLANVINVLDPDAIVIGGGLSNIDLLFSEGIKHLEKFVFNHGVKTKIFSPKLGDSSGVFGAALLLE